MVGAAGRVIVEDTTETPLVSVIIPHWNGIKILTECLDSLKKSTWKNLEIIVVDNASTDESVSVIQKKYPDVKLVECVKNLGYAGGCNAGSSFAFGEYIIFLNNDTIQESDWIEPLVEKLQSNEKISSVQPKIKNYYEREKFDYAGGCGGEMDIFGFPFAQGRIFNTVEEDTGQYDTPKNIFWASGTAFMTRKSIFFDACRFDDDLFAHMEEIDYHWKCHLMGYSVMSVPNSVVYHMGGKTLKYQSPQKTYLNHRNSFLLLLTNYSIPLAAYLFLPRLFLEILSGVNELITGRFSHFNAIMKSLVWLIFHPHIIIKRIRVTRHIRKLKDRDLINLFYPGSIVWSYFILKRQTFISLKMKK